MNWRWWLKKNKGRITELCESLENLSQQVDTIWLENDTLLVSFALTIGDRWLEQKRRTDQGEKKQKQKQTQPSTLSFQNKYVLMLGNGRIKAKGILHFYQMPFPMLHRALALPARLLEMQILRPQLRSSEFKSDLHKISGDLFAL